MAHADRAELEQWLNHRDAEAFRAIVARHAAMVYTTCRRILQNTADAEDVTQECFESLVQARQLPRTTYLGAWLHGIATNRAMDRLRRDLRREQRDVRYGAQHNVQSNPHEWDDIYEFVDEVLTELPEELRSPIIAHFLEGRTHREIAAALGVPRRTVTNRIARGLDQLSDSLRGRGITMPAVALGALLGQHAAAETLPPSLANSLGKLALAQGKVTTSAAAASAGLAKLVGVSVAVAVVAAGIWWWSADDIGPSEKALAIVESGLRPADVPTTGVAPGQFTEASGPARASAEYGEEPVAEEMGTNVLLCEVVQEDLTPTPGVVVTLMISGSAMREETPRQATVSRHGRTDAQGEIVFSDLPARSCILVAQAPGQIAFGTSGWGYFEQTRLVLQAADTFSGVVRDAEGKPSDGAEIFLADCLPHDNNVPEFARHLRVGATDEHGAFSIPFMHGYTLQLHIRPKDRPFIVTPFLNPETTTDLAAEHGQSLEGTVFAEDTGEPVPNARVFVQSTTIPLDRRHTVADEAGHFVVDNLRHDTYGVLVRADSVAATNPAHTVDLASESVAPLHVAMGEGGAIGGRVTDAESGEGLSGVDVGITLTFADVACVTHTITDTSGAYEFTALPPATYVIAPKDPDLYQRMNGNRSHRIELAAGERKDDADFALASTAGGPAAIVAGSLIDDSGRPVPRAVVSTNVLGPEFRFISCQADGAGRFQMLIPLARDARFWAYGPHLASEETKPIAVTMDGLKDLTLVLHPTGSISGKVVTTSGRPFGLEDVVLRSSRFPASTVQPDGAFRLTNLPAGEHPLTLDVSQAIVAGSGARRGNVSIDTGIQRPNAVVSLSAGEHLTDVEIPFDDDAYKRYRASLDDADARYEQEQAAKARTRWKIEGRVIAADTGLPVTKYAYQEQTGFGGTTSSEMSIHEDGRFHADVFNSEEVVLSVVADGYSPRKHEVHQSQAIAGTARVTIKLQPSPVVEGAVVNAAGAPVVGAQIYAGAPPEMGPGNPSAAVTDANGAFRLDSIGAEPLRIYADCPGYALGFTDATPSTARVTVVRIVMSEGGRVEGTVTEAGKPVEGTRVGCDPDGFGRKRFWIDTGADGRFSFDNIAPGTTRLSATPRGANIGDSPLYWVTADVREGATTQVTIVLPSATSRVEGRIAFRGDRVLDVKLQPYLERPDGYNDVAVTVEDGVYRTDLIAPGTLRLWIHNATPAGTLLMREVEVGEDEIITFNIEIPEGFISGTVSGLEPDEHATVYAMQDGSIDATFENLTRYSVAKRSVEDGGYILEGLEPGAYTVIVYARVRGSGSEGRSASAPVTVAGNEQVTLDFALE